MSVEVNVPQLGESLVEATVGQWRKQEGDAVESGEALVELETDKVNIEVVAPQSGVLQKINKHEGDVVGIGDVLALVAARDEVAAPVASGARPEPSAPAVAAPPAAEVEPSTHPAADTGEAARATPVARRMAAEQHIDLSLVKGTGAGGRITHEDLTTYLADRGDGAAPAAVAATAQATATRGPTPTPAPAPERRATPQMTPLPAPSRPEERVRMSRRRLTIAHHLVEAQHTAAMLTTFNEVDMSAIMDIRKRRRDAFKERHGVGLGFMSFFTKAVVGALKGFPRLNAEIQGDEMVLKRYYDIGIAVSTDEGLVVPVIRDADRLSFAEIERQIAALAERARNRTLSIEDLLGGTFTITNGGIFGSLLSTPILNAPQVGILGMHKIQERPIAVDGQVVIRPMMYVAVSYDHRIVDGAESVSFLVRVKEMLEDPERLLLEG